MSLRYTAICIHFFRDEVLDLTSDAQLKDVRHKCKETTMLEALMWGCKVKVIAVALAFCDLGLALSCGPGYTPVSGRKPQRGGHLRCMTGSGRGSWLWEPGLVMILVWQAQAGPVCPGEPPQGKRPAPVSSISQLSELGRESHYRRDS